MRCLVLFFCLLFPLAAQAQQAATLVADNISVEGDTRLIAQGNIEVFHDGTRLSAAQIIYDRPSDRLIISGPIFIQGRDGSILTAERATLDPRLENGMLQSARLVLNQQLQLAANQIDRADGRFSQLYKTAVTSCAICGDKPPLWEIRAERIVHDEDAGQLYFTNAQFRLAGVPLIWLPRVRLPDPTVDRATGLLVPRLRNNTQLGTGLKLPYFVTLGNHRDLLLTPYISNSTRTLEARYRQAFLRGDLSLNLALSDDTLQPDARGYVFAEGAFDLNGAYKLRFDVEAASDDAYLLDYGYSEKDRLDSAISLTRVDENALFDASFTYYQTLRDDEENRTLPPIVADIAYTRRLALAGGTLSFGLSGDAIVRYGSAVGDEGRDVTRVGATAQWDRTWISDFGLASTATAALRSDWYDINDAVAFGSTGQRYIPSLAATFRFPLVKSTRNANHLIEPLVSLAWSDAYGDLPPNEDSTRPEFGPGNLLSLSRFPGDDRLETGLRGAVGLRYTRNGRRGTAASLTAGRIYRDIGNPDFTVTSGQRDRGSDWLLAGQIQLAEGLRLEARSLLSEDLTPTLTQAIAGWETDTLNLNAAYIYQIADADVGRSNTVSEWSLDGAVRLSPAWRVGFDTRYDVIADAPARAGIGLEWRNECVTVELSASRRYTSSTTVEPSTDYGLSVSLAGFSTAGSTGRPSARCNE